MLLILKDKTSERAKICVCIYRAYLLSSFFFSEANFPENADLVFFIFKNKRAKEDAERENKRESSSSSARGIDF